LSDCANFQINNEESNNFPQPIPATFPLYGFTYFVREGGTFFLLIIEIELPVSTSALRTEETAFSILNLVSTLGWIFDKFNEECVLGCNKIGSDA
jgi:hypothetical protein